MVIPHPNLAAANLIQALQAADPDKLGNLTLPELFERAPPVSITIRLPALAVLAAETFAEKGRISRNALMERLVQRAMNEMVETGTIPALDEDKPAIQIMQKGAA